VSKNRLIRWILASAVAVLVGGCSSSKAPMSISDGPEIVEGGVIFHYFDRDAKSVHVAGDFNAWSPVADPLTDSNGDGEWTLFFTLSPGTYQYKFVVDAVTWIPDPRNPDSVPDGFDGRNSVVRIPRTSP
jgi:1,4-alpha-glucan branching enzyme